MTVLKSICFGEHDDLVASRRSKMRLWTSIFLLLVLALVHTATSVVTPTVISGGACPSNSTVLSRAHCSCYTPHHVHCPGLFTASSATPGELATPHHLAIQCHGTTPLPISPALPIDLDQSRAVVLTDCAFGDHALLGPASRLTDLSVYCRPGLAYSLTPAHLEGLSGLRLLHLWCPGLEGLHPKAFAPVAASLTHLTLRGSTSITSLTHRLFDDLRHLVLLRIRDNALLAALPAELLRGLKGLRALYLDHNALRHLPGGMFQGLEYLSDLSLIGNELHVLEPAPGVPEPKLVLLGQVDLARALHHDEIPQVKVNRTTRQISRNNSSLFRDLQSLTELRLDSNFLPTLSSVRDLRKLRLLSVRNCSLRETPADSLSGLSALEMLDLSLNTLGELPVGLFQPTAQSMQTIVISENRDTLSFSPGVFHGLQALRQLDLSRSGLRDLPFTALQDLKSLRSLDLSHNALSDLPRFVFQGCPSLESINLAQNALTSLSGDLLENLFHLRSMDVSGNSLSRLPPSLFSDTRMLIHLDLSGNKLRTLGSLSLLGLTRLSHLDLGNNVLATLDPELFSNMAATRSPQPLRSRALDLRNFTRSSQPRPMVSTRVSLELRNLSLANNRLAQLPSRLLAPLIALERLDLSNNSLSSLPILSFLKELEELWVAGNRLRELPAPLLVDGGKLRVLSLRNNFVTEIPPSFLMGLGETLAWLDVSHNSLAEFSSPVLSGLESLSVLDISHNKLRRVDFSALPNIHAAELGHNALTFKEAGWVFYRSSTPTDTVHVSLRKVGTTGAGQWGRQATFGNCTRLRRLGLANNSLSDILLDLRRLPTLASLDLRHNSLGVLEARDLQFASNNLTVDVRHNRITQVRLREDDLEPSSGSRQSLAGVRILIDHNPLICDCRLPNLLRYLFGDARLRLQTGSDLEMHPAELVVSELACQAPPSVRGKRLLEVETWGHYLLPLLGLCHVFQ